MATLQLRVEALREEQMLVCWTLSGLGSSDFFMIPLWNIFWSCVELVLSFNDFELT